MPALDLNAVRRYIEENIETFQNKRLETLNTLKLSDVLKRKNPYLYKAKNVATSEEIVKSIVDAHISSNEETVFGDWLEGLAIFVNHFVYGGGKSGTTAMDLEFDKDGTRYIVTIKSGPNWGNSRQKVKMEQDFASAQRRLRTGNSKLNIVAVNGCCYGRDNKPDKGSYYKYCGQRFWQFISNEENLYTDIIEPLGESARARSNAYMDSYTRMINKFVREFSNIYCRPDGSINWNKLVKFNSSIDPQEFHK
jgi:hypothetical protein